jgi:adenylyl-sulfate kinase
MTQSNQHDRGVTLWMTGLSGAGKSTISAELERRLRALGKKVEIMDGDEVRTNLSKGLGFSKEDRDTNIKRIGFVSKLLTRNGVFVIGAAISPYRDTREFVKQDIKDFIEIYVKCSLEELVRRDVKGLYAKAIKGEIQHFTGVSDPYEEPLNPDVLVDTERESVQESVDKIMSVVVKKGYLPASALSNNGAPVAKSGRAS